MSVEPEYRPTEHLFPQLPARIASLLGLDVSVASQAVSVMVPTMIDGLAARASSGEIAREIADILARADRSAIGALGRMAPGTQHYRFVESGLGALGRALGTSGLTSLTQTIVRRTGLTESAALDVAGMIAPVVFASLAQHQAGQGLSPNGLVALLRQQREHMRGGTAAQSTLDQSTAAPTVPVNAPPASVMIEPARFERPAVSAPPSFPAPPREPPQTPVHIPASVRVEPPVSPAVFRRETIPGRVAPPPASAGPPGTRRPITPPPEDADGLGFDWRWLAVLPLLLLIIGGSWWFTQTSPLNPEPDRTAAVSPKNQIQRPVEDDRIRDTERARLELEAAQLAQRQAEELAAQRALADAKAAEARRLAEARARQEAEQRGGGRGPAPPPPGGGRG